MKSINCAHSALSRAQDNSTELEASKRERVKSLARFTFLYKKQKDGNWKIANFHSSQQPDYVAERGLVRLQVAYLYRLGTGLGGACQSPCGVRTACWFHDLIALGWSSFLHSNQVAHRLLHLLPKCDTFAGCATPS